MKFHDVCSVSKGHWTWDKQNSDFIFVVKLGLVTCYLIHRIWSAVLLIGMLHTASEEQG